MKMRQHKQRPRRITPKDNNLILVLIFQVAILHKCTKGSSLLMRTTGNLLVVRSTLPHYAAHLTIQSYLIPTNVLKTNHYIRKYCTQVPHTILWFNYGQFQKQSIAPIGCENSCQITIQEHHTTPQYIFQTIIKYVKLEYQGN